MTVQNFLHMQDGRALAYNKTDAFGDKQNANVIVFLGGLASDKEGTKAIYLEDWAKQTKRNYLRFDYTGHGQSSGEFLSGSIGDWAQDSQDVIETLTSGPVIIVGSSMGGWIGCLITQRLKARIAGFVGIAAAPDFTEDSFWPGLSEGEKAELHEKGHVKVAMQHWDDGYIITRKLIEDGRHNLVLRTPLEMNFPVRLLHGAADDVVAPDVPQRLFEKIESPDCRLTYVKHADHRFSEPSELKLISDAIEDIEVKIK